MEDLLLSRDDGPWPNFTEMLKLKARLPTRSQQMPVVFQLASIVQTLGAWLQPSNANRGLSGKRRPVSRSCTGSKVCLNLKTSFSETMLPANDQLSFKYFENKKHRMTHMCMYVWQSCFIQAQIFMVKQLWFTLATLWNLPLVSSGSNGPGPFIHCVISYDMLCQVLVVTCKLTS